MSRLHTPSLPCYPWRGGRAGGLRTPPFHSTPSAAAALAVCTPPPFTVPLAPWPLPKGGGSQKAGEAHTPMLWGENKTPVDAPTKSSARSSSYNFRYLIFNAEYTCVNAAGGGPPTLVESIATTLILSVSLPLSHILALLPPSSPLIGFLETGRVDRTARL